MKTCFKPRRIPLVPLAILTGSALLQAQEAKKTAREQTTPPSPWAAWVEPDFPFFSTVIDARKSAGGLAQDNLSPRSIVLNLGRDCWLAFDPDLLRVAAVWRRRGVTPRELAPGSYHNPGYKTQGGQSQIPEPDGEVWLVNGIYPGWQAGATFSLADPREPAPSVEEVGRGAIAESVGLMRFVRCARAPCSNTRRPARRFATGRPFLLAATCPSLSDISTLHRLTKH
jgi:hypothetical protein